MPLYETTQARLAGFGHHPVLGRVSRSVINAISPAGERGRLSILIYHRVLPAPDPLFPDVVDAKSFEQQMRLLSENFQVMSLAEASERLRRRDLPARAACVTFDDGYADNAEVAMPILRNLGIPATFFIATGFLDGGRMWNDTVIEAVRSAPGPTLDLSGLGLGKYDIATLAQRRAAIGTLLAQLKYLPLHRRQQHVDEIGTHGASGLRHDLMMSSQQVRALHTAGMDIGGHTVCHPILAQIDLAAARNEIAAGKETLESLVRAPIRLFAYPNGTPGHDYLREHVKLVRSLGFTAAVSTAWGAARYGDDVYQLPRFTPWDRHWLRFTLHMIQNMGRTTVIV